LEVNVSRVKKELRPRILEVPVYEIRSKVVKSYVKSQDSQIL
jgi:hypothetical protein